MGWNRGVGVGYWGGEALNAGMLGGGGGEEKKATKPPCRGYPAAGNIRNRRAPRSLGLGAPGCFEPPYRSKRLDDAAVNSDFHVLRPAPAFPASTFPESGPSPDDRNAWQDLR